MGMFESCKARAARLLRVKARCEKGSASVEAVMWFPFMVAVLVLVVDGTIIFHNQSIILRVAQDANRAMSVGRFIDEQQTEDYIEEALSQLSTNVAAETVVNDGVIQTFVRVPAADIDMIGLFSGLSKSTMTVYAQHLME